jgi:hypothetical protein
LTTRRSGAGDYANPETDAAPSRRKARADRHALAEAGEKHYARDSKFQAFVRKGRCEVHGHRDHICFRVDAKVVIEFAHCGVDKGVGVKCADEWGIALCHSAHREQHDIGWKRFEKKYGIDRLKIAAANHETYSRITGKEVR